MDSDTAKTRHTSVRRRGSNTEGAGGRQGTSQRRQSQEELQTVAGHRAEENLTHFLRLSILELVGTFNQGASASFIFISNLRVESH